MLTTWDEGERSLPLKVAAHARMTILTVSQIESSTDNETPVRPATRSTDTVSLAYCSSDVIFCQAPALVPRQLTVKV